MTIQFSNGYALPSGDQPLTHARIAHAGNWLTGGTVSASTTAVNYFAEAPANTLTYEFWKPVSVPATWAYDISSAGTQVTNLVFPSESLGAWALSEVSVTTNAGAAPDGANTADKAIPSAVSTGHRLLSNTQALQAGQSYILSVFARASGYNYVRLSGESPGFSGGDYAYFDLASGQVGVSQLVDSAGIQDYGGGWFRCWISLTAADSDLGRLAIYISDTNSLTPFAGDGTSGVELWGAMLAAGAEITPYIPTVGASVSQGYATCDYAAVAAHNLSGASVQFQAFDGVSWVDLTASEEVTSDEPIFAIFPPQQASQFRLAITNAVGRVGVVKFGRALQMERPIYGGHAPMATARQVVMRSNASETGEFLGRTKQRVFGQTSFSWEHLSAAWVRANWRPFQIAAEDEPFFIAWRPETFGEVAFGYAQEVSAPQNTGQADLMSAQLTMRARAYD